MTNLDSILKSRDITLPTKVHLVKAMVFSSSHVWMWELDYRENWAPKNWHFWTVVLEKTLEISLDWKEIKPVSLEGNQSWIFTGRNNPETETSTLATWCKELTHWKRPDAGKDWRQAVKGTTEDKMVGWHHWPDGRVWANSKSWWWTGKPGVLYSPWVAKGWAWLSDWTELILLTDFET